MSSSRPPSKLLDLDITILSAKHLHNCNWRQGDLKPYLSFWIEPNRRFTTKTDDSGSTSPVWNERFTVPINGSISESLLFLEVSHSGDPSLPPPVVGSVQFPLKELVNSDESKPIRNLGLLRPSGRPQGKLRVKVSVKERERPAPEYHIPPPIQPNYYYSTAPPPPPREYSAAPPPPPRDYSTPPPPPPREYSTAPPLPPRDYRGYTIPAPVPTQTPSPYQYPNYSDPYSGYYPGYYSQLPPPPRPYFDQVSSYGGHSSSPSAPVDYSAYDQRNKGSKMGVGTGLAVGAVAGALGGLALEEGLKHEEEKIAERVEKEMDGRENYGGDYRSNY
ncbi:hypothetical protein ACHQM5_013717 [Ranunculus cassubicifolius]